MIQPSIRLHSTKRHDVVEDSVLDKDLGRGL